MNEQAYEQLTLFPEDSLVSLSPWLESKKEKGMSVTYGRKCSELSENLRRVGLSVRTYLESCDLPLPTLSRTWSVKDMTSRCLILKLRLSARSTDENDSLLWPTPAARDYKGANSIEHITRPGGGRNHLGQLPNAVALFPTPTVWDSKGLDGTPRKDATMTRSILLAQKIYAQQEQLGGGQLNPTWVEWPMGFPTGWTDLNASETP